MPDTRQLTVCPPPAPPTRNTDHGPYGRLSLEPPGWFDGNDMDRRLCPACDSDADEAEASADGQFWCAAHGPFV